ncbi:DUF2381 family protein [Archangium lansingense]|uniref:DUF2381 family protein n=1 Tax=Archangium lansingense TaxID=2995310 RepID=A0ABT4A3K9_9BACT|nr:DUF2381 family protein [Archangium lansinium]MCY1075532.1 DUF2381 family protein [Archangium lansinium]
MSLAPPSVAQTQPPARERQERQVVLPSNPNESAPEARVAAGVATYLRFDAPIDKASLELEGRPARFRWVEAGERLVAVEPSVDLGAEEKLVVRVRYKDGASPAVATLVLVSHPTLVDKEVEVVRRPRTLEALEAALAEKEAELAALRAQYGAGGPAGLVFSGRIDRNGVVARSTEDVPGIQGGLKVVRGMGYRAGSWALAVVRVRNLPGQKPWAPGSARLTRADGTPVKVLSVEMDKAQLAPGEEGLVAVEPEVPYWKAGQVFRVEVLDKSGVRRVPILNVEL